MGISDFIKWIAGILKAVWFAAINRPQVTCDIHSVFKARCYPDFFHYENGNTVAEGICINLTVELLLANNGPVDTTLKDAYILVKQKKKVLGRLEHNVKRLKDDWDTSNKVHGVLISR